MKRDTSIRTEFNGLGRKKVVSAEEAVQMIRDGDTVATGGFCGAGFAEEIALALESHYLKTGTPKILLCFMLRAKEIGRIEA